MMMFLASLGELPCNPVHPGLKTVAEISEPKRSVSVSFFDTIINMYHPFSDIKIVTLVIVGFVIALSPSSYSSSAFCCWHQQHVHDKGNQ